MRTLNDYFLMGGNIPAVQTADSLSDVKAVVPDGGRVVGFIMNGEAEIATSGDVAQSFDIMVNDADSGVNASVPEGAAADRGSVVLAESEVLVNVGDKLQARSNGEQVAACAADITWIIRR